MSSAYTYPPTRSLVGECRSSLYKIHFNQAWLLQCDLCLLVPCYCTPQSTLIQPRRLPFYRRDRGLLPQRIDTSSLSSHIPHHWPNTHLFLIALSHQPSDPIHQHQGARVTLNLRANPLHTPALTRPISEKSGTKFARQ